jgi:ABC-type transport system involved in multi-copper enzyme maturation permease subunit
VPIHDQGYRRYQGTRAPVGHAWLVMAKAGLRTLFAKRAFIALMLLAWIPFVVRVVQLYAATNLPQATFLAPDVGLFRRFLEIQELFLFFITIYAGAGLIANDRRANALQIYLARPLTRFEYILGKFAVLMSLLLFVTWIPALLLVLVQILFSGSLQFFLDHLILVPAITLLSFVQATAIAAAMLALSSLSRSSRYVGILYAGLIFFSQAIYGVLYALTRDSRLAWVSLPLDLAQLGDAIFQLPQRLDMPLWLAVTMVVAVIAVSAVILERRVRGVEIVA